MDLCTEVGNDCTLNILTANDKAGLAALRHTTSHVLAEAVKNLYPDAKLAIGPSVNTGFYYDFECQSFTREDLDEIEREMKRIIKKVQNWRNLPCPGQRPSNICRNAMSLIR